VDKTLLAAAKYSVNVTTGILSIDAAEVVDNLSDVTINFTADNATNSLAIAQDLLFIYGDYAFIDNNFDLGDWTLAQAAARNVGLYMGKEDTINKWLEKLFDASDAIFYTTDAGLFSARVYDADRVPVKEIYTYEFIENFNVTVDESSFLSSVKISYFPDEKVPDNSFSYLNKDYEREVLKRYKAYNQKEFKTILASAGGAAAKSEVLMLLGK
jgi:hypothetical protein